jgi:hypothetical protein
MTYQQLKEYELRILKLAEYNRALNKLQNCDKDKIKLHHPGMIEFYIKKIERIELLV